MKVLFVTQSLGRGGAERLVLDLARVIKTSFQEVEVKIVPLGTLNDYPELSEGLDIQYCSSKVKLSLTGKNSIDINEFEKIVDEFKPDIIHSHTYIAELVSRENIRDGIVYFTHVHNDFPEFDPISLNTFKSKEAITNYFERIRIFKKYKKANNQFITISRSIDDHLRAQLSRKWYKNIHLLLNGIDFNRFNSKVNLPDSKTINLISVGRLFPVKNHTYLLDVVHELKRIKPDLNWNLNILGIGPEKENLMKKIENLDLSSNVHLQGLIPNVEDWFRNSHVYVHSALSEPFGLVITEAMSSSLPVVCLDGGGNRDLIDNGINGYILPQTCDPKRFAETIIELVEDAKLFARIADSANKKAEEFDIKNCARKLISLYKEQILLKKSV